jgi:hypothetical protein
MSYQNNNNGEWNDYFGAGAAVAGSAQAIVGWAHAKRSLDDAIKKYSTQLNESLLDVNHALDDKRFSILARNVAYSTYMGAAEKVNKYRVHGIDSDGIGGLGFYLYRSYSFRVDSVRNVAITDEARNIFSKSISKPAKCERDSIYATFISTLIENMALDDRGLTARDYMQYSNHPSAVLEAAELFNAKAVGTETWDRIVDNILEKRVRESVQINKVEYSV